jgi:hypothetical protein
MDRERVKKQDGKATQVSNVDVNPIKIHPEYCLESCDGDITPTGLLQVLKLVINDGQSPGFSARWDERAYALDIDINDPSLRDDFKNGRNGYAGHHTLISKAGDSRTFEVNIKTPQRLIFEGTVSFSLTRPFLSSEKVGIGDHVDEVVIRANRNCE